MHNKAKSEFVKLKKIMESLSMPPTATSCLSGSAYGGQRASTARRRLVNRGASKSIRSLCCLLQLRLTVGDSLRSPWPPIEDNGGLSAP